DMAQADMAIEDMAIEPDMAAVDMAAEDMAVAPDMAASTCQDLIGQRCELDFQQGCCEPGSDVAVVICSGGTYRATGDGDFCNCFGNPAEVACAVPGFVGVHRSGWRPQRVMRLRAVA
ncbi:MAG: hypothetical protein KC613_10185, partial [Myxococcales bacterium]|nr:hypothetical protein [Myxococcales bacterium]